MVVYEVCLPFHLPDVYNLGFFLILSHFSCHEHPPKPFHVMSCLLWCPMLIRRLKHSGRTPITSAHLAPPRIPDPKPWTRVAVPARSGQRIRIWKRVGPRPPSADEHNYVTVARELRSCGAGSRKRARAAGHVPPLSAARWEHTLGTSRDGVSDLVEARGMT